MTTPDTTATLCGECATVALCLLDGCASRLPDAVMAELDVAALRAELDNARRDLTEVEAGWQQADSARQRLLVDRSNLRADVQLRDRQLDEAHATIERQRAECSEMAGERDAAQNVTLATRQMANEANTRLRAVLLAALGLDDDGRTSLTEYVTLLADERDTARAVLKRTEELWMRDSEVAKTGIEDTIRHHHQINALEQRLADALKIADDNAAEASAAWHEAARVSAEWDEARRTAERLAAERDEATRTLAELAPARQPDTALTDLRATVKRLTADRDRARREAERFTVVQRLSQRLTRELEQIRADAAVLREDCDVLDDKAARWRKRAKRREEQRDYSRLLVQTLAARVARMSRVVEAARRMGDHSGPVRPGVPDSYLCPEEIALRAALTTYEAQVDQPMPVTQTAEAERSDCGSRPECAESCANQAAGYRPCVLGSDGIVRGGGSVPTQVPPTPTGGSTEPRVWQAGDPEPGPEVIAVRDKEMDVWTRLGADGCQVPDETDVDIYVPAIRAAALRAAASDLAAVTIEREDGIDD